MTDYPVKVGETIDVSKCSVGEWIILTTKYKRIGKFRDKSCAMGEYSWPETYDFELDFNPDAKVCTLTSN